MEKQKIKIFIEFGKKKKKKTKDEYSPKIESTDDANDGNETAYLKFFQENIVVLKI